MERHQSESDSKDGGREKRVGSGENGDGNAEQNALRVHNAFGNLNDFEKFIVGRRILDTLNHKGGEGEYRYIFDVRQETISEFYVWLRSNHANFNRVQSLEVEYWNTSSRR